MDSPGSSSSTRPNSHSKLCNTSNSHRVFNPSNYISSSINGSRGLHRRSTMLNQLGQCNGSRGRAVFLEMLAGRTKLVISEPLMAAR
jgi:hypothetical protein